MRNDRAWRLWFSVIDSKVGRLNKKPEKYLRILDAAAKLLGENRDDLLLEVFSATSLYGTDTQRQAAPEYDELARTPHDIASAVAIKHDLQAYFQAVARDRLVLTVANGEDEADGRKLEGDEIRLEFSPSHGTLNWPISFLNESADADLPEHSSSGSSVPSYPAVRPGVCEIGKRFPVEFESEEQRRDGECGPLKGTTEGLYLAELRLCIVPVGSGMRPEAALRINITAYVDEVRSPPLKPFLSGLSGKLNMDDLFGKSISEFPELRFLPFPQGKEVKATVYPSRRSIMCRLTYSPTSLPPVTDRYYHFVPDGFRPGGTCRFVPVTGLALEDWFSLPSRDQHGGGTGDGLNERVLGEPLITGRSHRGFSSFPADTIAAGLDHCLVSRDGDDPLTLLDERAGQFVQLLKEASERERALREAGLARLQVRLQKMRGKDSGSA